MSTITQRTKDVEVYIENAVRTITVRRMPWKASSVFIATLGKVISSLRQFDGLTFEQVMLRLPEIISQSEELVMMLLTSCSSLTSDEIKSMAVQDVIQIIHAALEVNLDEKTKNSCAGIAAVVKGFMTQMS